MIRDSIYCLSHTDIRYPKSNCLVYGFAKKNQRMGWNGKRVCFYDFEVYEKSAVGSAGDLVPITESTKEKQRGESAVG